MDQLKQQRNVYLTTTLWGVNYTLIFHTMSVLHHDHPCMQALDFTKKGHKTEQIECFHSPTWLISYNETNNNREYQSPCIYAMSTV